jgi:uncharacterized protein
LDCDRIDYLLRDSYYTGASYGQLDLDRILLALDYDAESRQLVVAGKGQAAIEHYLVVRYFMYGQIYNHPKNLSATWLLEQAFGRARELLQQGNLEADEVITAWLSTPIDTLPLALYLAADDIVLLYHLQRWQHHRDPILADLCHRFLDRRLFKAWDVSYCDRDEQAKLLHMVQLHLMQHHCDAERYSGLRRTWSRGYTQYQRGIKLKTPTGLVEISQVSPLVKTLSQPNERTWLLYPPEFVDEIKGFLEAESRRNHKIPS